MNIDINKPLKAKVFDADIGWNGTNSMVVDVQAIVLPHLPYTQQSEILYNGGRSATFELLPQD